MGLMKFFALLGAIFVSSLISYNASAIYLDSFSEFSENNIIFYNPEAKTDACRGGGECSIRGDSIEEKLWSGLRGLGFTPEETSAIMGNILHEGGSPVRQEDCYNIARDKLRRVTNIQFTQTVINTTVLVCHQSAVVVATLMVKAWLVLV